MDHPFLSIEKADVQIQEELTNETLKAKFQNGDPSQNFGFKGTSVTSNQDYELTLKIILIIFPSSYLVERKFSVVMDLVTKKRNQFQIVQRGDLYLRRTKNIEPNVEKP